jgi:ABC-type lipoprotein export system ATPase subunit
MTTGELNTEVVRVTRLTKTFRWNGNTCTPVRDVSFMGKRGELILLLGRSGSGKTTLLTVLAGLAQPSSGKVRLFGKSVTEYTSRERQVLRAQRIGFVFQNFHLLGALPVLDNVALVPRFAGASRPDARRRAREILQRLGIAHLTTKLPKALSQGEAQRVAVARAIATDAQLILADEPTASLEANQGLDVIQLLHDYAKSMNRCVIVASHDRRIDQFADMVLYLENGTLTRLKKPAPCPN